MANRRTPHDAQDGGSPAGGLTGGEAVAFGRLFEAHFEELARYAVRYLGSVEEAKDVVHDVFLRLWRRRAELDLHANLRAYLYAMTRNRALDLLRQRGVEDRRRREYEMAMPVAEAESTPPSEAAVVLRKAIAALPQRQREVVELRWWQQASYEEIGRILGISPNTAGVHMMRAIERLRQLLRKDPFVS